MHTEVNKVLAGFVLKTSKEPTLPKMRPELYEKTPSEAAYFLGGVSPTSPKIGFYGKVFLTGTW